MYLSIRKDVILGIMCVVAILWSLSQAYTTESVPVFAMPVSRRIVWIDAGHGAFDPGKVAGTVEEKDINLAIALKLQAFLETGGATVFMTRLDDQAISSTKQGDMYTRRQLANASQADIFVSIHQNSFPKGSVHGAQVFYFDTSNNSRKLAESIQQQIKTFVGTNKRLEARPNENYYVLRQTTMPAVIVECGFLTNYNDRSKLTQADYQERMAWGIYLGIVQYFDELDTTDGAQT
ncbi:MAG: N-acetylmuramoyl-L-alanine amidase [Defluviitaleaceae bacterium]|nr:N-acetylmuramoyl-L-alanine amidase [Defluviitaleaceae bacterium]